MKLIVAIMTLFLGASIAMAQPAANSEAAATRAAQHLERLSVLLDLTDTQKLQVQQVLEEQHAKMKALHDQMKASGQKPSFAQMKATREQMHTQTLAAVKPLLSADQYKKFVILSEHPSGPRQSWRHAPVSAPATSQ
jgi:Spy/CpxP family protein refolding chaperone